MSNKRKMTPRQLGRVVALLQDRTPDVRSPVDHDPMVCKGDCAGEAFGDDPCWQCIFWAFGTLSEIFEILDLRKGGKR